MQRKPGTLTPLEIRILETALGLAADGETEFYGFGLAKRMKESYGSLFRTAHGPLYRALDRLEQNGLLQSRWEDPETAAAGRRPRRCFFRVTPSGIRALELVGEDPRGLAKGELPT